ncbi:hypothetical protein BX281_3728 [Streptomyces sp. Ag82_O1-15]|uniref:DUF6571 family protein n=1 Tax=Streptomyces sp. Ag82_O1-15 TaxID=1938855 RepID=UPI000BB10730|nr:DUF6571 family protein [Streptomyces sp. Ag82_O1-15]PBC95747.1 hypothetical protein BX281_3728 [Streptomyces sp. Ag82_O1-15]
MDLDALRYGNFHQLGEAITDWQTMAKNLKTLATDADKNLKGKAHKANWAGKNATVTREFVDKTVHEFTDAHTQADTVAKILSDTRGELIGYRTQVNDAIERGVKKNLTVMNTGDGAFVVTRTTRPDWASDPSGEDDGTSQADANALRDEIQRILDKAAESDSTAAKVLRLIVDQAKYGFSGADYEDRDSAAKAVAEADAMAKILAKNPHDVTNTELATLNANLAKYKNDPLFAEEFAERVGPKKLLTFYAGIADPYQAGYDPERGKQAKQLQKNLGITIGQATLSDSDKMQGWEKQIIKLGPDQLGIDDASNPTGYAVMSNLMRFGDYDDQFLNDYGDKLLAYDKQVNGEGISLWVNNANQGDLNYWGYKDDRGRDPVTGFLEALGHNPDASSQFFAQPDGTGDTVDKSSEINEHLKYLTKERVWMSDVTLEGKDGYVAGRDSLGHALESATTGYAYDASADAIKAGGEHRTAATAGVMEEVAYLYGSEDGPKMLHDQPELADSLGKMAGAYIDDIDYNLSGVGEYEMDEGTFPPKYQGRANFTQDGTINFLSVLGQDENSHRAVTAAQHLYTLSALDAYPPNSDANIEHAHDALTAGAQARGILDNSRVEQAETTYKEDADEANKSLGRSADWIKLGAGAVVGGGIAAIPLPGSTAAALVVAPLAADTVGEAVNTFIGQEIDKGVDDAEQDPAEQAQLTSSEFYKKGENQLGADYHTYVKDSPKAAEIANNQNWNDDIKGAYLGIGSHENDYRGRAPYKD